MAVLHVVLLVVLAIIREILIRKGVKKNSRAINSFYPWISIYLYIYIYWHIVHICLFISHTRDPMLTVYTTCAWFSCQSLLNAGMASGYLSFQRLAAHSYMYSGGPVHQKLFFRFDFEMAHLDLVSWDKAKPPVASLLVPSDHLWSGYRVTACLIRELNWPRSPQSVVCINLTKLSLLMV